MPNSPARWKRGYTKVVDGNSRAKKKDVAGSVLVTNKAFATSAQELGSPNGGPAPIYNGSGQGPYDDYGAVNPYEP
jgi:hypothetical protein